MDIHAEHWQEPTAVTAERPEGEKYCESCGEDLPFHNSSCSMLKNAYKRRLGTCTFCKEKHRVGDQMREHVESTHQAELRKLLYGKEN